MHAVLRVKWICKKISRTFFTYREKWFTNYKIDKHLCYMDITMKVWDMLSYSWTEYVRRVPALFGHWLARQCKIITIAFNYEFKVCNVCTILLENQVNREILWEQFLHFFTYRESDLPIITKWTSTCVTLWKYGIRCPTGELNNICKKSSRTFWAFTCQTVQDHNYRFQLWSLKCVMYAQSY